MRSAASSAVIWPTSTSLAQSHIGHAPSRSRRPSGTYPKRCPGSHADRPLASREDRQPFDRDLTGATDGGRRRRGSLADTSRLSQRIGSSSARVRPTAARRECCSASKRKHSPATTPVSPTSRHLVAGVRPLLQLGDAQVGHRIRLGGSPCRAYERGVSVSCETPAPRAKERCNA